LEHSFLWLWKNPKNMIIIPRLLNITWALLPLKFHHYDIIKCPSFQVNYTFVDNSLYKAQTGIKHGFERFFALILGLMRYVLIDLDSCKTMER